jgi:hypothetical protein
MRHPWRLTVPGRATRHPPAWFPVWRLGGQGNLSVPGHAGSAPLDRRPAWVDPRHAWMLQVPGPAPATHGVALPPFRRVGGGGSARVRSASSASSPTLGPVPAVPGCCVLAVAPSLFCLGCCTHTSPLSTGWRGWGGGTVRRHGWRITSPHGRVHGGSRDPTHAVPPRVTRKCGFGFGFRFDFGSSSSSSSSCRKVHRRSPLNTRPVILRLSRRPRGH